MRKMEADSNAFPRGIICIYRNVEPHDSRSNLSKSAKLSIALYLNCSKTVRMSGAMQLQSIQVFYL